jgi:hypothetical protein
MIAPVIGSVCAEALLTQRNYALASLLATLAMGIVGSYEFGRRLLPETRPVWLAPMMCLTFTLILILRMLMESRRRPLIEASHATESPTRPEPACFDFEPVSG